MPEQVQENPPSQELLDKSSGSPAANLSISNIEILNRVECFIHWEAAFSVEPPPRLSVEFMRMALAYEFQCNRSGPDEKRSIEHSKSEFAKVTGRKRQRKSKPLSAGAELVREWNGRTHRVRVVEGGYEYAGETYASLSAIAREITGTRWSGPRFFGVKG